MFRSLDEVKRECFPNSYKKEKEIEKLDKMTSKEKGSYFGKQTIEKVKRLIKNA
jgi:hypothetical protein